MDLILYLKYFFLGLVQGFTEPIPVSSSGHLEIVSSVFGIVNEGLSFAIIVNFASLLAVLLIYKKEIASLAKNNYNYVFKKDKSQKSEFVFFVNLIIATIPAGLLGVLLSDIIDEKLSGIKIIGYTLLITALALFLIKNMHGGKKTDHDITIKDALIVGFAQVCALIPGISRSGATIVAAMAIGINQKTALKFSFFLYIPVSIGASILGFSDLLSDPKLNELIIPYSIAFVTTFFMTYIALKWFMGIMEKGKLMIFSIYCLIMGLIVIMFL